MKRTKLLAVVAVIVLCLSFSSVAYAETGSTGGVVPSPTGGAITSSDLPAGVVISAGSVTESNSQAINSAVAAKGIAGSMVFLQDVNLTLNGNHYSLNGSATFTINVSSVHVGDKVTVVHLKADGTVEFIAGTAGEGTVTFTISSLSPIGIIRQAAAAPADTSSTATTATTTSPKTNEADDMSAVWFVVLAASVLSVALVLINRKKATSK